MRIAVIVLDTRGGVQPYIALTIGLQAAGHEVRMVVHANAARGIPTVPLTGEAEQVARDAGVADMNTVARQRFMRRVIRESVRVQDQQALDGCPEVDLADIAAADDILVIDQAPHDWLFPRCSAVVHHGGAGATGAAVREGVPAVVVPFGVDQPFWASRVAAPGTSPDPIPRKRLAASALGHALRVAAQPAMRYRAAEIGGRVRAEDGVAAAVGHFDALAARLHLS